jgi:acetyl-CoA C-acetyltransferase
MDGREPIIVGVGQVTQRPETERPVEPLALMAEAARRAERDAAAGDLLHEIDSLRVVNVLGWPSKDPPHDLASALAVAPREAIYTAVGGNTPQWQVNDVAGAIGRGDLKLALVAGAEANYSARRARAKGIDLGWSPRGTPHVDAGDTRPGFTPGERVHGGYLPTSVYPLFENAIRHHYGRTIPEHQQALGELFAPFSAIAAKNEYAWFRQARTGQQIATPTRDNRYIGFPYTKTMNAIMDVDQGAAILLSSVAEARRLGIPEEKWVYVWGGAEATDHWFFTERENYHTSPAIRAVGEATLAAADVTIGEVTHLDLYSCFPSAVQIARDMLGIGHDDPRALTVTGGLPYFGGAGNNYVSHSIANMVMKLRGDRGTIGLVTANGWYVTKHAAGVYSTDPPRTPWSRPDPKALQAAIDARPRPEVVDQPFGAARIETYTVIFDRDGAPERAIVIGRDAEQRRFIANTSPDRRLLEDMTKRDVIGAPGTVRRDGEMNVITFA